MHNLSYGNEFDFQNNGNGRKTHFHMKGCAPRLALKQRGKASRKWPIASKIEPPTHTHEILFSSALLITEKNLSLLKITKSHYINPCVLLSLLSLSIIGLGFN